MDIQAAAILGAWLFAASTAISKQVSGWFMIVAFIAAMSITYLLV
jgi:hypothetical protein